ncbi:MAG TPA: HEPN domain-containing protein [Chryseolinea sp.]|nr:HEPN domain-containing protein [Chryseolinea sp.]
MKTSLEHLPENERHEIQRIIDIIREVVEPEIIILFGSYAQESSVDDRYHTSDGIANEYLSDYDFLVITRSDPKEPYAQESTIMDRVDRYRPPVNIEIYSIDYVNEGLRWGQCFFTEIVKVGIVVHDTGISKFVVPRELTSFERRQRAQDYFDIWFKRGVDFYGVVPISLEMGSLKVGVFNLHQATESLYYTVLLVFGGHKPRLHNLWRLRKKAKPYSSALYRLFQTEASKHDDHLFDLLKRGYIDARYKEDYIISVKELSELIDRIGKMIAIVESICHRHLLTLGPDETEG